MKNILYTSLLAITLLACTAPTQPILQQQTTARQDSLLIINNFNKQEICWNNQDLVCYMQAYSKQNNIQTISKAGITTGYDNILADYHRYFPKDRMGKLHFDNMQLKRLSAEYYYVVGRFNLKPESRDTLYQGYFSVLMQKENDDWFIISDHSS